MLRELLRRVDMMVILENRLDALVRLHTPWPPGLIGHPHQYDIPSNLAPESLTGPNAGLTEMLIPAGYVTTVYDPVFSLSADRRRYVSTPSHAPTTIPEPGLPFSLVFRAEPGKEDVLLKIASAYEAASMRRIPPPMFGPLTDGRTTWPIGGQQSNEVRLHDGIGGGGHHADLFAPPENIAHAPILHIMSDRQRTLHHGSYR